MIKAIETSYAGFLFRSRTEARWAIFFDALGIRWEYEKEGYDLGAAGWYLPDFWLPLATRQHPNAGHFVEIKGEKPSDEYLNKLRALAVASKHSTWCLVGSPWDFQRFVAHNSNRSSWDKWRDFDGGTPEDNAATNRWLTFCRWETTALHPLDMSFDKFQEAVDAAKRARFEHGANGAGR